MYDSVGCILVYCDYTFAILIPSRMESLFIVAVRFVFACRTGFNALNCISDNSRPSL